MNETILLLNYALLIGGVGMQISALRPAAGIVSGLPDTPTRQYWRALRVMIFLFIGGYLAYGIVGLVTDHRPLLIVSFIFFGGAWFVRLVCTLALQTVGDIQRIAQLEHENTTDALTGLSNRRYLDIELEREVNRCKRYGFPLSVVMVDVDHFKSFNDQHGHAAGDAVLQELGQLLKSNVRETDIAARYGGEELTLVLPHTEESAAALFAERLRGCIAAHEIELDETKLCCTVSLGVAALDDDIANPAELMRRADHALYQAKSQGRNRVVAVSESPADP